MYKRLLKNLLIGGSAAMLLMSSAFADVSTSATQFSPEQTKQIEKIVHNYLVKNPEVVVQVLQALQNQQQEQMEQKATTAIKENVKPLFYDSESPVLGNPNGKVTLVEFYDYQCPHCKSMAVDIENIIKHDPNIRVIFKEWAIFPNSELISSASLASQKQGKYQQFHLALMKAADPITKEDVFKIAQSVGLNVDQLKTDMKSDAIKKELANTSKLAQTIGLVGTPGFIVASNIPAADASNTSGMKYYFIPGEVPKAVLQKFIAEASKAAKG